MKQTEREKTKVFRTLIRCIRMGDKPPSHASEQTTRKKNEKQQEQPPSFSAGKPVFWLKTL